MTRPPNTLAKARPVSRRSTQSVTLMDVAAEAGVSAQTVSRAVRDEDSVSEETLKLVKNAIKKTGYVPNLAASNLASNRSMTIAVLVPNLEGSIFTELISGVDEAIASSGYHLFVGSTSYDLGKEEELIRAFLGRRPDGIVIVGTSHTKQARLLLSKANIPIVEVLSMSGTPIDSIVGFSNSRAIRTLTESRIAKGFKHPTFAGWLPEQDLRALERLQGFTEAVENKLPHEKIRVLDSGELGISIEAGRSLARDVLVRYPETDLLVCSSDVFAEGAILELSARGIAIPERMGVTGLGDFDLAKHLSPSLTTVQTPNKEVGKVAAEILLEAMSSKKKKRLRKIQDLGFEIVSRESA